MAKASLHSGRASSGSAKHNDKKRNFKKESNSQNLDYIDDEKSKENINLIFYDGKFVPSNEDLQKISRERYDEVFGKALEEQNQKAVNSRHMERVKTIDDWMTDSKHGARETILQIGSDKDKATRDGKELSREELKAELQSCFDELNVYMTELLGNHYQPMHAAIHMDELTPHMHWDYSIAEIDSKTGTLKPGLNKGLEQAGIELPNEDRIQEIQKIEQEKENSQAEAENRKPKKVKASPNKYNNRLVTLTSMVRDKWEDIILSHGIEIERSERCDRQHEDQNRYRQKELQKDIIDKKQSIDTLDAEIASKEAKKAELEKDIASLQEEQTKVKELIVKEIVADAQKKIDDAVPDISGKGYPENWTPKTIENLNKIVNSKKEDVAKNILTYPNTWNKLVGFIKSLATALFKAKEQQKAEISDPDNRKSIMEQLNKNRKIVKERDALNKNNPSKAKAKGKEEPAHE